MKIRPVREADAEELVGIYRYYVEETAVSFEYETPTTEEFADRIRTFSAKYPYLVAEEGDRLLGYAYAHTFIDRAAYDWSVETTIYLAQDARRQGIGSRLYLALEQALSEMGILNMNACIALPRGDDPHLTDDSIRFHGAMGFQPVGTFHYSGYKFDTWYDMIWMEKIIGPHNSPQEPPQFANLA